MELYEMKSLWEEMSQKIEKQKSLTDKLILEMTQERYRNKFGKIANYESIAAVICIGMAVYLLLNIGKLGNWYLFVCDIMSATILIALPLLSMKSIQWIKNIDFTKSNYRQTLIHFAVNKKRFLLIQRINFALSALLMIICLPVIAKIIDGKDIFLESKVWYWYIPVGTGILFFFGRWVYSCYKLIAISAGQLLEELDQ